MDVLRSTHPESAVMLVSPDEIQDKVSIAAQVPEQLIARGLKAGDWVREASQACGGKGGGKPDKVQGGGNESWKVTDAVRVATEFAVSKLN